MPRYYRIKDKSIIARQDGMFECYLYAPDKGWIPDKGNILMDRLVGYDPDEIGSSDVLSLIEQISEEEAALLTQRAGK